MNNSSNSQNNIRSIETIIQDLKCLNEISEIELKAKFEIFHLQNYLELTKDKGRAHPKPNPYTKFLVQEAVDAYEAAFGNITSVDPECSRTQKDRGMCIIHFFSNNTEKLRTDTVRITNNYFFEVSEKIKLINTWVKAYYKNLDELHKSIASLSACSHKEAMNKLQTINEEHIMLERAKFLYNYVQKIQVIASLLYTFEDELECKCTQINEHISFIVSGIQGDFKLF